MTSNEPFEGTEPLAATQAAALLARIDEYATFVTGRLSGASTLPPETRKALDDIWSLDYGKADLPSRLRPLRLTKQSYFDTPLNDVPVQGSDRLARYAYYYIPCSIDLPPQSGRRFSKARLRLAYNPGAAPADEAVTHAMFPPTRSVTVAEWAAEAHGTLQGHIGAAFGNTTSDVPLAMATPNPIDLLNITLAPLGWAVDASVQAQVGGSLQFAIGPLRHEVRRTLIVSQGIDRNHAMWCFKGPESLSDTYHIDTAFILEIPLHVKQVTIHPLVSIDYSGTSLWERLVDLLGLLRQGGDELAAFFQRDVAADITTFEQHIRAEWEVTVGGADIVWDISAELEH